MDEAKSHLESFAAVLLQRDEQATKKAIGKSSHSKDHSQEGLEGKQDRTLPRCCICTWSRDLTLSQTRSSFPANSFFFFLPSFIFLIYDREIAMSWFKSENVLGMGWLGARRVTLPLAGRLPQTWPCCVRASNPLSRNKKRTGLPSGVHAVIQQGEGGKTGGSACCSGPRCCISIRAFFISPFSM